MYQAPEITMTMLGAPGCGKTTYLHGMYATLSSGVNGYFLYATDPDKDLDLSEAWEELCEEGTLPDATSVEPLDYEFAFKQGMTTLLKIDYQDFRGGAGTERLNSPNASADIPELNTRLAVSDLIVLTLDGGHVAHWINEGMPANSNPAKDPMKIARFSRAISKVVEARHEAGKLTPAIVVLLTKTDVLAKLTGQSTREALDMVRRNLFNLVPVLAHRVTVLLCPVQIGSFDLDRENTKQVRPDQVDPKNLHKPIIFALMHYLTEVLPRRQTFLDDLDRRLDQGSHELASLRGGFLGGFFSRGRINTVEASLEDDRGLRGQTVAEMTAARKWAEQMADDLRSSPIYRDGKLQEG